MCRPPSLCKLADTTWNAPSAAHVRRLLGGIVDIWTTCPACWVALPQTPPTAPADLLRYGGTATSWPQKCLMSTLPTLSSLSTARNG